MNNTLMEQRSRLMEEVARLIPKTMNLKSLSKAYPQCTIYALLRVHSIQCELFVSAPNYQTMEMVGNSLKPRLENLCKDHEVMFMPEDRIENSRSIRVYTIYPTLV